MTDSHQIKATIIVSSDRIFSAWNWFYQNISYRPIDICHHGFIFDNKTWAFTKDEGLLSDDTVAIEKIQDLYLASQFSGDPNDLVEISQGKPKDIKIRTPKIENNVKKILQDKDSFRYSLSENLACWVQLVALLKTRTIPHNYKSYVVSLPNASPRNQGPDGLSLVVNSQNLDIVEIRSVKSAKSRNPKYQISSDEFENGGTPDHKLLIDEFYLICNGEYGFTQFDRLLTDVFYKSGRKTEDEYRAALIQKQSKLNAVVVANQKYATPDIFSSYKRIQRDSRDKIATYIGFNDWDTFADNLQEKVNETLKSSGVI